MRITKDANFGEGVDGNPLTKIGAYRNIGKMIMNCIQCFGYIEFEMPGRHLEQDIK